MPTGAKKISQLPALTRNDSEIIPVVQDDGLGNLTTGTLPIADFGTDTNIYNTDGTLTGNRTIDNNGYSLTINAIGSPDALSLNSDFGNGLYAYSINHFGVLSESTNSIAVRGTSTNSYGGSFVGANGVFGQGTNYGVVGVSVGTGVYGYSTGTGYGVVPFENSGSSGALNCQGKALFDGTAATGSSLVEINSTTQGVLLPRMTTTQRNAIGSPATGLEIYNTTTNRKEVYNGSYWQGVDTRFITISFSVSSPQDSLTLGFGSSIGGLQNVAVYPTYADMRMSGIGHDKVIVISNSTNNRTVCEVHTEPI